MENYSIPSVANNHRKSFSSTIEQTRNYLNRLESDYESKYQLIDKLSNEKKKTLSLLEDKYKKYNITYDIPLIKCDINKIEKYSEELASQLSVSFIAVDPSKQVEMNDDLIELTSLTARVKQLIRNIEMIGSLLDKLENELSTIRVPEVDSKQELTVNFKDVLKKKKENKKEEKKSPYNYEEARLDSLLEHAIEDEEKVESPLFKSEVKEISSQPGLVILDTGYPKELENNASDENILDTIQISLDEIQKAKEEENQNIDVIPASLFNEDEKVLDDEEEINSGFLKKFFSKLDFNESTEPKKVVRVVTPEDKEKDLGYTPVVLKNGVNFIDYVESVYTNPDFWVYVYNFNERNKGAIDRKAAELGLSIEQVINDPNALAGIEIDFPVEMKLNEFVPSEIEGYTRH